MCIQLLDKLCTVLFCKSVPISLWRISQSVCNYRIQQKYIILCPNLLILFLYQPETTVEQYHPFYYLQRLYFCYCMCRPSKDSAWRRNCLNFIMPIPSARACPGNVMKVSTSRSARCRVVPAVEIIYWTPWLRFHLVEENDYIIFTINIQFYTKWCHKNCFLRTLSNIFKSLSET